MFAPLGLLAQVPNTSKSLFPRKYQPGDKYRYQLTCQEWQNEKWTSTTISTCELTVITDSAGIPWDEVHWLSVRRLSPQDSTDETVFAQSTKPYRISLHPRGGLPMPKLTVAQMTEPISDFNTFFVAISGLLGSSTLKKVGDKYSNSWQIFGDFSNGAPTADKPDTRKLIYYQPVAFIDRESAPS